MRILLVEADAIMAADVRAALGSKGYDVVVVASPDAATSVLADTVIEAVIVDRPFASGEVLATVGQWREGGIAAPIFLLSAQAEVGDRIAGLRAGADDYIAKPFELEELEARLSAALRARDRHARADPDIVICGSIRLDRRRREAERAGKPLMLQPREFRLLETLAAHCDKVVPRSILLEKVWNLNFDPRTKLIETHISRLRDKLAFVAPGELIDTVRGIGYRLRSEE